MKKVSGKPKADKTTKGKTESPKAKPRKKPEESDDKALKRKLIMKLNRQKEWRDLSLKECQKALEKAGWDYDKLMGKPEKKRRLSKKAKAAEEAKAFAEAAMTEESDEVQEEQASSSKKREYIQGLDWNYIKNLKYDWEPSEKVLLKKANKELKSSYSSWEELSEKEKKLSEDFLTRYQEFVSWYHLFKTHDPESYTEKFKQKMKSHFLITKLNLIEHHYFK